MTKYENILIRKRLLFMNSLFLSIDLKAWFYSLLLPDLQFSYSNARIKLTIGGAKFYMLIAQSAQKTDATCVVSVEKWPGICEEFYTAPSVNTKTK